MKPPVPDAARVRSLLAEEALRDKNPKQALKYYLQGLELHPMWPQAWFNAALISGELRDFDNAAEYMQNYLMLAPDAPDASQARDQLEMWKIKAKEK
jgi:regulator of sirC expression with transglutaminase-like and TPR domain